MRNHNFPNNIPPFNPTQRYFRPGPMPPYGFPPRGFNPGMIPPGVTQSKGALPKLEAFMETCNKLLATAQGFQPYIAQATPLVKNLPALWRMYKGFKETDGEEEQDESSIYESSEFEYVYKEDLEDEYESKNYRDEKKQRSKKYEEELNYKKSRSKYEEDNDYKKNREYKYDEDYKYEDNHYKHKKNAKKEFDETIDFKNKQIKDEIFEHKKDINQKKEKYYFSPVHREKKYEPQAVKLQKKQRMKPSVPKIFQPDYDFLD